MASLFKFGRTPLHMAARDGQTAAMQELIQSATLEELNAVDDHGFTPLYHACNFGHHEVVVALLATPGIDHTIPDKGGLTPFHIACYSGRRSACVTLMMRHDPTVVDVKDSIGRTGKDWARDKGNGHAVQAINAFLAEGATAVAAGNEGAEAEGAEATAAATQ
jgi:ankyrin repeat protein